MMDKEAKFLPFYQDKQNLRLMPIWTPKLLFYNHSAMNKRTLIVKEAPEVMIVTKKTTKEVVARVKKCNALNSE
jgi:hypothetical protein